MCAQRQKKKPHLGFGMGSKTDPPKFQWPKKAGFAFRIRPSKKEGVGNFLPI